MDIHNQQQCSRMSQKLMIRHCLTKLLRHSSTLFNLLSNPWCWSISRSLLRILKNCRIKFILCHVRFLKNWIVYTGFNGLIALDRKYLTYVDLCCQVFSNIFFEINSFKFESVKWQFQITYKFFKQSEVISLETVKCQNRVQIQRLTELKSVFFNSSDLLVPHWVQLRSN